MSLIKKHLPNALTGSRIFLAAGFIILLHKARFNPAPDFGPMWRADSIMLFWADLLFVLAAVTDIIDGPLARRWGTTSAFGRWFDPFVDKILIIGGLVLIMYKCPPEQSGFYWWMVILVIVREVYITIARTILETRGKAFGASWSGKIKMILQCIAIGVSVFCMTFLHQFTFFDYFRLFWIWLMVIYTAYTAVDYTFKLIKILKQDDTTDA